MDGGQLAGVGSQIRLVAATSGAPGSLGGVRAAMARAASSLQLDGDGTRPVIGVVTPAGRSARATGPSLRTARRRTRRYAERRTVAS